MTWLRSIALLAVLALVAGCGTSAEVKPTTETKGKDMDSMNKGMEDAFSKMNIPADMMNRANESGNSLNPGAFKMKEGQQGAPGGAAPGGAAPGGAPKQ
jgi:hypothetical protein